MNLSDKLIIFCIIFLILAIISTLTNCIYFNNKIENFSTKKPDKKIIKQIIEYISNEKSDNFIIKYMKKNEEAFKNPRIITAILNELNRIDKAKSS